MSETKVKHIVVVKPIIKDGIERILNGAKKGLACPMDEYGNMITGHTPSEIAAYKTVFGGKDPKEYFETLNIILSNNPLKLDLDNEKHLLWYRVLKVHPDVANTTKDISIFTKWVIEDEEEEARKENQKFDEQINAYANIKAMSPVEKRSFLALFGKKTRNVSDEVVMKSLKTLADSDPAEFNKVFDDKDKVTKILLKELIEYRILEKDGAGSIYHGENLIGIDERHAVATLTDPKKQQIKIQLMDLLDEKKKI